MSGKDKLAKQSDTLKPDQVEEIKTLENEFEEVVAIFSELEELIMEQDTNYQVHTARLTKLRFLYTKLGHFYDKDKKSIVNRGG